MRRAMMLSSLLLAVAALGRPRADLRSQARARRQVPMRDGVKLSTDVYRPDAPGKFPVVLQRTPYDNGTARLRQARPVLRRARVRLRRPGRARPRRLRGRVLPAAPRGRGRLRRADVVRHAGVVERQRRHARRLVRGVDAGLLGAAEQPLPQGDDAERHAARPGQEHPGAVRRLLDLDGVVARLHRGSHAAGHHAARL